MIRLVVEGARRNGGNLGIFDQASSDYPEIAEFLVRLGIDSISLTPNTDVVTTTRILEPEMTLGQSGRIVTAESAQGDYGASKISVSLT